MKLEKAALGIAKIYMYAIVAAMAACLVGMFFTDVSIVDIAEVLAKGLEGKE